MRVGTLDTPDLLPPDVHIFTASKQPWVAIPQGVPCLAGYYDAHEVWTAESLAPRAAIAPQVKAYRATLRVADAGT